MLALTDFDAAELQGHLDRDEPVWLDLTEPSDADLNAAGELFGLHPLAIEDSRDFNQRPKVDRYRQGMLLVFYGLALDQHQIPRELEVHIHVAGANVLTVSRWPPADLHRVRQGLASAPDCDERELVYRLIDTIADTLVDGMDKVAAEINAFEKTIYTRPRASDRDRMAKVGRKLNELRRTIVVQRQMFDHIREEIMQSPGREPIGPYLGDIADHLAQAFDEIEADRDTISSLLQTYSNAVQERLTIVATIFLPLTALTGFFGMNFNWLTNHIGSTWTFFGLGLGGMLVSCVLISAWLQRSGLIDRPSRTT